MSRHVVRGLLDKLPIANKGSSSNTDQKFSAIEFLVIFICFEIEFRYGIQRSYLQSLYPAIFDIVSKPRSLANDAKLLITVNPLIVQYFDGEVVVSEGLLLPLMNIFKKVDSYLSPVHTSLLNAQRPLDWGPIEVPTGRSQLENYKSNLIVRRVGGSDE